MNGGRQTATNINRILKNYGVLNLFGVGVGFLIDQVKLIVLQVLVEILIFITIILVSFPVTIIILSLKDLILI